MKPGGHDPATMTAVDPTTSPEDAASAPDAWPGVWPLAVVFGLVSVPWTYGFVAGLQIPLWPAFVASATYFAADAAGDGGSRPRALLRTVASNGVGVAYGAGTLAVVVAVDGGPLALSLAVGVAMLLASLHAAVPVVSFTPGGFFGYATLFSVDAAGATVAGIGGLAGATLATAIAMAIGALIGIGADLSSERFGLGVQ